MLAILQYFVYSIDLWCCHGSDGVKNESIEGKHWKEEFGDAMGCAHHFSETQACARQERMEHASVLRRERLAYAQDAGTHTLPQVSISCE